MPGAVWSTPEDQNMQPGIPTSLGLGMSTPYTGDTGSMSLYKRYRFRLGQFAECIPFGLTWCYVETDFCGWCHLSFPQSHIAITPFSQLSCWSSSGWLPRATSVQLFCRGTLTDPKDWSMSLNLLKTLKRGFVGIILPTIIHNAIIEHSPTNPIIALNNGLHLFGNLPDWLRNTIATYPMSWLFITLFVAPTQIVTNYMSRLLITTKLC